MSDLGHDDDNATEDDDTDRIPASLREAAKRGKEAEAEAAKLRKELMFVKAGIDTDTKVGKMLFNQWEGDNLDDLRTEATELGLIGAPPPARGATAEDAGRQAFAQGLGTGAAPAPRDDPGPDPYDTAYATFDRELARGVPREDAALAAFGEVFKAAVSGDKRAIFDPAAHWQAAEEAQARRA